MAVKSGGYLFYYRYTGFNPLLTHVTLARLTSFYLFRPIATSSLFVLSPTNKLLHYEPVAAVPRKKRAHLPGSIFDPKWGEEEVEVRNDLIDCGIDVCSVDVSRIFESWANDLACLPVLRTSPRSLNCSSRTSITNPSDSTSSQVFLHLTSPIRLFTSISLVKATLLVSPIP